ncbi:benzoate/H(+) symporter BenE family transporter [Paracoccus sp. MC1854]|nr:benzoate/H(+) symporter BenE family transporter [Paracoccus sp. MC1854]
MSLRFRITGLFDRFVAAIPKPAAKGMMAGILFGFAPSAMGAIGTAPLIFAVLVVTCLVFSVLLPRCAVVVMLAVGLLLAWLIKGVPMGDVRATLARPALT